MRFTAWAVAAACSGASLDGPPPSAKTRPEGTTASAAAWPFRILSPTFPNERPDKTVLDAGYPGLAGGYESLSGYM